jgi:hypothetical protein
VPVEKEEEKKWTTEKRRRTLEGDTLEPKYY